MNCQNKLHYHFKIGYLEHYTDYTRNVLDQLVKKAVGLCLISLLTSFLLTAAINYLQVFYLPHERQKVSIHTILIFKTCSKNISCRKVLNKYILVLRIRSFIGLGYASTMILTGS